MKPSHQSSDDEQRPPEDGTQPALGEPDELEAAAALESDTEATPSQVNEAIEGEQESEDLDLKEGELQAEVERLSAMAEEYLDGWQRARADFSNYKKRIEREQQETYRRAAGDILTRYLTIVDDLERALKDRPTEGDGAQWAEGVELIYRKLHTFLEAEGVEPIDALGQPFDPNLHEAISHEDSEEYEAGHVIEVLQQGYRMGETVLRPALVRVAR